MRVIAGTLKGRKLLGPKSHAIRPALDQVKEAIFNILFDVKGFVVLDLFAGTGAMGIEALSRGAARCTFVDPSDEAATVLKKNLENLNLTDKARFLKTPAGTALKTLAKEGARFDLVFCDPPYNKGFVTRSLADLEKHASVLKPGAKMLMEHHPKEPVESTAFQLSDQRTYGQTLVSTLIYKSP